MSVQTIISSVDSNALTLFVAYFTTFFAAKIVFLDRKEDLNRIRLHVIQEISRQHDGISFLDFLDKLQEESKVLLFKPTRNNSYLAISSAIFAAIGLFTIFYSVIPAIIDKDILYLMFAASFGVALIFFLYDTNFYREYRRLKEKYPVPNHFKADDARKVLVLNE